MNNNAPLKLKDINEDYHIKTQVSLLQTGTAIIL